MKKKYLVFAALAMVICSCDEWDQVFTADYGKADVEKPVTMTPNATIAELKALYVKDGNPVKIEADMVIGGQVVTEDRSGNVYRSIYIQDESGAIELKIGKTGLYNDYKLGQWIYVKCSGLTLGKYNGMLQLGYDDPTGDYETAYIDVQYIIDTHIFKGSIDNPLDPKVVAEADLQKPENLGCYVTLNGVKYGSVANPAGEIFCLIYIDPNKDKSSNDNRIFLSGTGKNYQPVEDPTWGVNTWAMSKQGFLSYLESGVWDKAQYNNYNNSLTEVKETLRKNASAYAVSQYFHMGSTDVQVRTSGYARFADTEIKQEIRSGATISLTGILTIYRDETQFTLIDLGGVKIEE